MALQLPSPFAFQTGAVGSVLSERIPYDVSTVTDPWHACPRRLLQKLTWIR